MQNTIECDSGLCFTIAKIETAPPGATYTYGARVDGVDGESVQYALSDDTARLHQVEDGDFAVVMFHPEGQHADIVSMRQIAVDTGHALK